MSFVSCQAILQGVPVISISSASPAWDVSCHDFSNLLNAVTHSACRKLRKQWTFNLANTMWSLEDIEEGRAFEYLLNYKKILSSIDVDTHKQSKRNSGIEIIRKFEGSAIENFEKKEEEEEQQQKQQQQQIKSQGAESSLEHHENNDAVMTDQTSKESTGSSTQNKEPEQNPGPIDARDYNAASRGPQAISDHGTSLSQATFPPLASGSLLRRVNGTSFEQHLGRIDGSVADLVVEVMSTKVSIRKNSTEILPFA